MCKITIDSHDIEKLHETKEMMKTHGWSDKDAARGFLMENRKILSKQELREHLHQLGLLICSTIQISIE